jgi:hypothetical protein
MESSFIDDRPSIRIPPSNIQDATAGAYSRQPKVTRCKMDEVPLGADSGKNGNCFSQSSLCAVNMLHDTDLGLFYAGAAFAHAATMSSYSGIEERHTAAKVPQSSGASRRCVQCMFYYVCFSRAL